MKSDKTKRGTDPQDSPIVVEKWHEKTIIGQTTGKFFKQKTPQSSQDINKVIMYNRAANPGWAPCKNAGDSSPHS